MMRHLRVSWIAAAVVAGIACSASPPPTPLRVSPIALDSATKLIVVTTPGWDSTTGELRRFVRQDRQSSWRREGVTIPIVVGRTGLAWGIGFDRLGLAGVGGAGPRKMEGDGRSPAGAFPVDTAFGFAPADSMQWIHLPYVQLTDAIECVDDTASVHYNTVVNRSSLSAVDWKSSERMRRVSQYRLGAIIGYNALPPMKGRGSCIFFHIWAGPRSTTVGCTALDVKELESLLAWLDERAHPVAVQIPRAVYSQLRETWMLPDL
jgi:D-alanyl-D-alanine dipeptidase